MNKVRLDKVAAFYNGRAFKPEEWQGNGLPIIRIQNLTGSSDEINYFEGDYDERNLIRRGDILISWSASLGVYIWDKTDALLNQHIFKVELKDSIRKDYFYHAATHLLNEMKSHVHGSTMQHITKDRFDALEILLPKPDEQKRIAGILDRADRLRRQRRYAETLSDTFLQSVFIKMFGDPFVNPHDWNTKTLRSVAEKISDGPFGSDLKSEHYQDTGFRVIRLQNIGIGEMIDDDQSYVSREHFDSVLSRHRCVPGDVIIGTMGEPNLRAMILPESIKEAMNKADCVQFRPNKSLVNSAFICWLLNMPGTLTLASGSILGQTRSRISMGRVAELRLPIPPLPLQEKFASIVQKFERIRRQQREATRQAEHLFQTLLHRAFRGEL